jgi:glycosyltransferase involved in cell wall biosynthesis
MRSYKRDGPAHAAENSGVPTNRVTFVTPLCGSDGGVALHAAASGDALRAGGHSVTIVCARSEAATEGDVVVLPALRPRLSADGAHVLEQALRDSAPDVIHIHDLATPDVVEASRAVAATVISAHGHPGCTHNNLYFAPGEECHRPHGPGCLANIAFRGCYHARNPLPVPGMYRATTRRLAAYRLCDGVVAYSRFIVQHLAENGLTGARVPLFTPLAHVSTRPSSVGGDREVLFVGRVVAAKGLDVLLRAMTMVDGTLTVVGDGWSRPAAEDQAMRLGVASRVRFQGWLGGDELRAAYERSSVVAVPSLWPEPFGLVGLEAMAFGKPVVASMTGGIRDWLDDGVTGIGVRPGDPHELAHALARVLDDPDLADRLGRAGRAALDGAYTEAHHVRGLEAAYGAARSARERAS